MAASNRWTSSTNVITLNARSRKTPTLPPATPGWCGCRNFTTLDIKVGASITRPALRDGDKGSVAATSRVTYRRHRRQRTGFRGRAVF
jgi:hypothetical protein